MRLTEGLELLATAPYGVARLRELILSLAVRGKLVRQDPRDEPASELLRKIRAEKDRLTKGSNIRRDKPLEYVAEDETPHVIPESWAWVRFGELGTIGSSSRVHQRDWTTSGVPFYRAREIVQLSKNGFVANDLFITKELFESLSQGGLVPECDDIMITGVGTIGVPYIVKPTDKFYFKDASVLIFKNRFRLDPNYLSLFLRSPDWIDMIHAESMGTTVHTLTIGRATETPIPLPPLAEQSRIVTKVNELMSLCDELEARGRLESDRHARLIATLFESLAESESPHALAENWSRVAAHFDLLLDRPEAVDALEQTILQLAVRGRLVTQDPNDEPAKKLLQKIRAEKDSLIADGSIKRDKLLPLISTDDEPFALPAGWAWARFGDIARISSNLVDPTKYGAMRQVAPDCIEKRTGRLSEVRSVKESGVTSPNHRFRAGQILYSKIRPSLSKAVVVDFDGLCSADMYPIDSYIDSCYLHRYILSQPFLEQVSSAENRVKMPKLNQEALNSFLVAVPPRAEQLRIVNRIEEMHRVCADLRARLIASQTCQARFAETLVGQSAFTSPLIAHTDDLAAAA